MGKVDEARKAYHKREAEIKTMAAPLKDWAAEGQAIEVELAALEDSRIEALVNGEDESAAQLSAVIQAKRNRGADLGKMRERRQAEIAAALDSLWANESRAVMLAEIESAAIAKQGAKDKLERLAPEWNRAQAEYQSAQQDELGKMYFETEFSDQRNRAAFVGGYLFQLLGTGAPSEYKVSWLQN